MRIVTAAAVAITATVVPATAAVKPTPLPGGPISLPLKATAAAHARPARAGARPVSLTLTLRSELQCGRLRAQRVLVTLPEAFALPRRIAPAAIRVGGDAPASVAISGRTVAIGLEPRTGLTCMSIGPGGVTVEFTPRARIGNPAKPGRYHVRVAAGAVGGVAVLRIRS